MSDKQTDVCTCGHTRAAHFEAQSQACVRGDCICGQFDKVNPLREAAPELLEACTLAHRECIGLAAYLGTCAHDVILDNLPSTIASLEAKAGLLAAAIRKAKGE